MHTRKPPRLVVCTCNFNTTSTNQSPFELDTFKIILNGLASFVDRDVNTLIFLHLTQFQSYHCSRTDFGIQIRIRSCENLVLNTHYPLDVIVLLERLQPFSSKSKKDTEPTPLCWTCFKEGDHWKSECPFKDLAESFSRKLSTADTTTSGTSKSGRKKGRRNAVRVLNISENVHEHDLARLFCTCGAVSRVTVAVDQITGRRRGFGVVNFVNKEDAEKAINKFCGYGYELGRILRVEWVNRRAN
ncbi:hypothetical protein MKW94_006014 [Papaver nudicaule]|uniref:RRM domain-containing protein n=1 Tax=Papaver nudicaule TaxID=74823 RepID=A0AA41UZW8_PAPNU|nr:hypothetical protein [Papaver nudicaule]